MSKITPTKEYFKEANSWALDRMGRMEASRYRYQVAFLTAMGLAISLSIAIMLMLPLKQTEPFLIHHYDNGIVTTERWTGKPLPATEAQIESDIVRYLNFRESYDPNSYRAQFELIHLLSSPEVSTSYEKIQHKSNPDSPVNQLGTQTSRTVHVYSISFLDQERFNATEKKKNKRHHADLAEVVFSCLDKNKATGVQTERHFTALIAWRYNGLPSSPEARWKNWNGFEVTRYSVQPRII